MTRRVVGALRGWHASDSVAGGGYVTHSLETMVRHMAEPDALRVDVDTARGLGWAELENRLQKAHRLLMWLVERRSPSGRGWHRWIGVWPRPSSAVETVALQLLCGSDPHREAYNLNRARQVDAGEVSAYWKVRWNVFYKKERERAAK